MAVSAGYAYTLALDMWGNVWAWGASPVANGGFVTKVDFSKSYDEDYYYGNAIPSTPAAGDEGENVIIVDISAGKDHAWRWTPTARCGLGATMALASWVLTRPATRTPTATTLTSGAGASTIPPLFPPTTCGGLITDGIKALPVCERTCSIT